jgi:hypothetical protein
MRSSPSILLALALSATAAVAAEDLSASNQPTQNVEVDPTLLTRYLNEHLPVDPVRVVFESRKLDNSK